MARGAARLRMRSSEAMGRGCRYKSEGGEGRGTACERSMVDVVYSDS